MSEEFPGYKGDALSCLKKAGAEIGDIIRITKNDETYEGVLIPRSEYGDEKHIIIKMKSGYNLGIRVDHITRIEKTGSGVRPTFTSSPKAPTKSAEGSNHKHRRHNSQSSRLSNRRSTTSSLS